MTARRLATRASRALVASLAALVALVPAGTAGAQQAEVKMEGRCEKLVIGSVDATQDCAKILVNTVAGRRVSFDFAAADGQTLSFSGTGAQQAGTELTDPLQPINLVVPGRKGTDAIVRSPAAAVGACRFTTPQPGKTMITCEATSQGTDYAGVFVTDAKAPPSDGKPASGDAKPAAGETKP